MGRLVLVAGISLINCIALFAMASMLLGADIQPSPRDLGPTLRPLAEEYNLPGVVGAIIHGDQIIAIGSTGVRKIGHPAPFLPADTIHIGSDTKAMTAILIGQLIDQKQLTLDTTMDELSPILPRNSTLSWPRIQCGIFSITTEASRTILTGGRSTSPVFPFALSADWRWKRRFQFHPLHPSEHSPIPMSVSCCWAQSSKPKPACRGKK